MIPRLAIILGKLTAITGRLATNADQCGRANPLNTQLLLSGTKSPKHCQRHRGLQERYLHISHAPLLAALETFN